MITGDISVWQLGFGILQAIAILLFGWVIKIMISFKHDITEVTGRIVILEKEDAVTTTKLNNIECKLNKIDDNIEYLRREKEKEGK